MSYYFNLLRSRITIDLINEIPQESMTAANREHETLLFVACTNSHVTKDMIQAFIEKGSDVNHTSEYGDNFLHNICYNKKLTVELLEYAVGLGFKVTDINRIGETPLHIISRIKGANFNDLFDYMLKHGAGINAKNIHGETPLYYYCDRRPITKPVLEQYVASGAILDSRCINPLMSKSAVDEEMLLYCIEIVKDLLGKDSDVLSYVAMHNPDIINDMFVETLLKNGSDIQKTYSFFTPLQHLCNNLKATKEQIRCLIRHGSKFDKYSTYEHSEYDILKYHKGKEYADSI